MKQEDIELTLVHDILTIKGEKKEEKEEKKRDYYRIERKYGSFSRSIPLPSDVVDNEKVEAAFAEGVLTITLPKLPEAQAVSKQIPIKAG
jgi:HSP20 family protein